ncbi:transglycosylase SLT domain-containing protein [Allorhizobium terrae]|uniref:Lytic transglycosylase domain-containing protein n=1 Tax=Allorhizobium terrae TaxID=1848972 RepID=A0A4S4A5S0_9HYPH|nr:transglycosylase SLT domain-containing protein [Allorhizobium terrae]THF53893.1 lytic transglycosylase domain-containing protein [Allorhizobium terrae]
MTAKTDRAITLSFTAAIVAALSSCTGANESAKANLAPKPMTSQVAAAASANTTAQTASATGDTASPANASQSAVAALASTKQGNAASAAIDLAAGQGPIPQANPHESNLGSLGPTVASVTSANAPASVSEDQPIGLESEALQPDVIALQSAIPMPRPASLGDASPRLAAATATAKPVLVSFATLDAQFDTSEPTTQPLGSASGSESKGPTVINGLVNKYAAIYNMPSELIHRVIRRESRYNPSAYHRGNYGLMQIRYNTARGLGYEGKPEGLFDPETNLKYAIKYLRGAWMVAENNNDNAVRLYARGYYNDAKRKGMTNYLQ